MAFVDWLQQSGWTVKREVHFVDVYAERGTERMYAEAKGWTKAISLDVDTLYGQLLRRMQDPAAEARYAVVVPTAGVAAAHRVSAWVRERLAVDVYEVDDLGKVHPISERYREFPKTLGHAASRADVCLLGEQLRGSRCEEVADHLCLMAWRSQSSRSGLETPVQLANASLGVLLGQPLGLLQGKEPSRVRVERNARKQLRRALIREVPTLRPRIQLLGSPSAAAVGVTRRRGTCFRDAR